MLNNEALYSKASLNFKAWILAALFVLSGYAYSDDDIEEHTSTDPKHEEVRKHQSGFFYGAMLGYKTEIYKGVDNDFSAFPVVGYRSNNFNFLGPFISYRLLDHGPLEVNSILRYNFAGYDSSDSAFLNGMEDRDASLDLGIGLSYKKQHWAAKFDAQHDVIGNSNGFKLKASIGKTFYFGPIFVEPNLGLHYWDNQYVDYYYGVSVNEATSGREVYQGRYAINKKLGLNISTPIFFGGFTRLSLEQIWYDASIANSPLTDSDNSVNIRMTFSRFF